MTESFKYRCNYHQNTHGTKLYDSSGRLLKSVSQSSTGHRCPKTHLIATHIGQLTQLTNHYSSLKKKKMNIDLIDRPSPSGLVYEFLLYCV